MKNNNVGAGPVPARKEKGITLIALIITIIVMLILVAVSIQVALNTGLFDSAGKATGDYKAEQDAEQELGSGKVKIGDTVYESIDYYIAEKNNIAPGTKVNKDTQYISNGKSATIPKGFTLSGLESESEIDDGLVIYLIDDKTDEEISKIDWEDETVVEELQKKYDQFVWIPVTNINEMFMCQSEGTDSDGSGTIDADEYSSCKIIVENGVAKCTNPEHSIEVQNSDGTKSNKNTLMAGRLYVTEDGSFSFDYKIQNFNANTGYREPAVITGENTGKSTAYDSSTNNLTILDQILNTNYVNEEANGEGKGRATFKYDMQKDYNNIVKSVYENSGFYIGRYEASDSGETLASIAGAVPSNSNWYTMYAKQKAYASNKGINVNSYMIPGACYDQVMRFVHDENEYNVNANNGEHGNTIGITANRDWDAVKNIYDLECNAYVWTLEACNIGSRNLRGGGTLDQCPPSWSSAIRPTIIGVSPLNCYSSIICLFLPENQAETFPFDWDEEAGYIYPWYIPDLENETINSNFVIKSASFKSPQVVSGKVATLGVKCEGVSDCTIKIFDEDGNELTEFVREANPTTTDGTIAFTKMWTAEGSDGEIKYYTICAVDSDGAYSSNYEVVSLTIK